MSEELDGVIQQMSELTNTIKDHANDKATIDIEGLTAKFGEMLQAQQKAILDNMPVRRGETPGEPVQMAVDNYQGRYARELKSIARDGEHRMGGYRMKAFDLWAAKLLMERAVESKTPGAKLPSEDLNLAVKALTATGAGTGDEVVPNFMASELWLDFFAASRVAADMGSIPMPTDPFDVPCGLGDVTWRKGTENTAVTASDPATSKSILTATEQVAEVDWSYSLDEDSIVAMMPALRQRLAVSGGEAMDAFVINADATATSTGNVNLDDATPASDSYYLTAGQDGIRHLAIVDNTGQGSSVGAAIDDAKMVTFLTLLGKYGLDYNNCRIVPGIAAYFAMLGLTNVATVDKYGPSAAILTGELARYRGIPVIPSASVPLTEADGKVSTTAGNNTKKQILAYHKDMWKVGFRRGLTVEVDRLIQKRQLVMVVSFRIAVGAQGTRSSATHTAVAYNIT